MSCIVYETGARCACVAQLYTVDVFAQEWTRARVMYSSEPVHLAMPSTPDISITDVKRVCSRNEAAPATYLKSGPFQ